MIAYLRAAFARRELLWHLVAADLKRKQRNTVLGFLWSFLSPVLTMLVYLFIFGVIYKSKVENYPIFLFLAVLPYRATRVAVTQSASSIVSKRSLIGNVAFPRVVLPLTLVFSSAREFLATLAILIPVSLLLGGRMGPSLLLLPVVLLLHLALTCGLAFLAATANAYFRDVENMLPHIMRIWFYLSPSVYTVDRLPSRFRPWFLVNPWSMLMPAYRDLMMYGRVPDFGQWPVPVLTVLLIFFVGLVVFWRNESAFPKLV